MASQPKVNLWLVEFVEVGKHEGNAPLFASDTFVATTFAEAVQKAEAERARYRVRLKIKALKAISAITA